MDDITWYGNQVDVEHANLGPLAVIFPLIQQTGLADIINQHLPVDPQAEFDHGSILSMLIAARMCSPVAISNIQAWAADSGADVLFNIPPEKLNDDRIARSLDAFFTQRNSILATFALRVAEQFDIPLDRLHYDPTHITFTGRYNKKADAIGKRVAKAKSGKLADGLFSWNVVDMTEAEQAACPPPARGCKTPTIRFEWSYDAAAAMSESSKDGYSAIVATVPESDRSDDEVFTMLREQNLVEHANRQLKSPLAVSPLYLHTPERVDALVHVLLMSLTSYFLIQREYRANLPSDSSVAVKERRTTTQTILRSFRTYVIQIERVAGGRVIRASRLNSNRLGSFQELLPHPTSTT